jgi:hypothetical protein
VALSGLASQLGLRALPAQIRKALAVVPAEVDRRLRAAVARAATVATAAVRGGVQGGLFDGRLAPEKTFDYRGKSYVLWVAEQADPVKGKVATVKVAERTAAGYRLVGVLTAASFDAGAPQARLNDLLGKARDLQRAAKRDPRQPPNQNTLPTLQGLQRVIPEAENLLSQDIQAGACKLLNTGCFAAGTQLLTKEGWRAVEAIRPGDWVLARHEDDPHAPAEWKRVEERFERYAFVLHLHVGGEVIRTTAEHPFYAEGAGWTPAGALPAGARIATLSGERAAVEEVYQTGEYERVYNLRVADYHTYFVGGEGWGFALWAHNAYTAEVNQIVKGIEFAPNRRLGGRGFSQEAGRTGARAEWSSRAYLVQHLLAMLRRYYPNLSAADAATCADCAATKLWKLRNRPPEDVIFHAQDAERYRPDPLTSPQVPAGLEGIAHRQYALSNPGWGLAARAPVTANLNDGGWEVALGDALGDGRGRKALGVYVLRHTGTGRIYKVGKAIDKSGLVGRLESYARDWVARGNQVTAEVYKLTSDFLLAEMVLRDRVANLDRWPLRSQDGGANETANQTRPQGTGGWTADPL